MRHQSHSYTFGLWTAEFGVLVLKNTRGSSSLRDSITYCKFRFVDECPLPHQKSLFMLASGQQFGLFGSQTINIRSSIGGSGKCFWPSGSDLYLLPNTPWPNFESCQSLPVGMSRIELSADMLTVQSSAFCTLCMHKGVPCSRLSHAPELDRIEPVHQLLIHPDFCRDWLHHALVHVSRWD